MLRTIICGAAMATLLATTAMAQAIEPGSEWENTETSTLTIDTISESGELVGTYVNRAEGYECQDIPFRTTGWVNDDKISFTVDWKTDDVDCESITSWVGYVSEGEMTTDWYLVYTSARTGHPVIMRGTDDFTRQ